MAPRDECWYSSKVQIGNSTYLFASNVTICIVNIFFMILSLILNGFVVHRYLKTHSRQPVSNTLLFILASCDLLQNIISQPVLITNVVLRLQRIHVCRLGDASRVLFAVFAGFGFFMVAVVLTTERMLALIFPIWRRTHLRKLHVVCISSGVFVLWSAYVVGMLYGVNDKTFFRPITASFIGISLVYALVGYTKIYFVCRKCTKMMRAMRKHELRLSVASGKLCKENLGCQSEKKERTDEVAQKDTKFTTHGGSHEITGNIFSMVSGRLFQNV